MSNTAAMTRVTLYLNYRNSDNDYINRLGEKGGQEYDLRWRMTKITRDVQEFIGFKSKKGDPYEKKYAYRFVRYVLGLVF